jgi:hypothetical protein
MLVTVIRLSATHVVSQDIMLVTVIMLKVRVTVIKFSLFQKFKAIIHRQKCEPVYF